MKRDRPPLEDPIVKKKRRPNTQLSEQEKLKKLIIKACFKTSYINLSRLKKKLECGTHPSKKFKQDFLDMLEAEEKNLNQAKFNDDTDRIKHHFNVVKNMKLIEKIYLGITHE